MQLPCVSAVTAAQTPVLPGSQSSQVRVLWQTECQVSALGTALVTVPHKQRCSLICETLKYSVRPACRLTRKSTALGLPAGPSGNCSASHREA